MTPEATLQAVKSYTARGFVIHPLSKPDDKASSPGKKPLIKGWQKLTTTPPDIETYIKKGCNLGLVCGESSGVTVLDIDHKLFSSDIFGEVDIETLKSSRTQGREHVYFKYNPNLPASKHHDLGIEILNDGNNAVLPPSVHASGDVYHWNDPNAPIIEMPKALEENLNELFNTETELKKILSKSRTCFKTILKDKKEMHGAEGREYMLAVCTDLKAAGATEAHAKMFAKLMYGKDYDESQTLQEWNNIDASKTWQCETLQAKIPAFTDCTHCRVRKQETKSKNNHTTDGSPAPEQETPRHIIESALQIMEKEDMVEYIINVHQTMHIGDIGLAKSILVSVGLQSVNNSDGIHPKVSGESGKGKTHCCKAMGHLLPKEYYIETTLSDKAIYYMDLKAGSVVFSDDVNLSDNLEGIIKRATSNFQTGDKYTTIDANRNVKTLTIPPRISWWLTSVDDNQSIQLLNRTFGGGVDESPEQDAKVAQFQLMQAVSGAVGYPDNDDVRTCRQIFKELKKHRFTVRIPFADHIIWEDQGNRRNLNIFLDIVKGFAALRYLLRDIIDGYLIATIEDFDDAKALYCQRSENQALKLTEQELRLCRTLNKLHECDSKTLATRLKLTQGRIHQLIHGIKNRNESGLLNKVKGLHAEKQSIRTGDNTVNKTIYSLNDFDHLGSYANVVSLSDTIRKNNNAINNKTISSKEVINVFNTTINKENNCSEEVVNTINTLQIMHSEKNRVDLDNAQGEENHHLCENLKTANNANNRPTDAENCVNNQINSKLITHYGVATDGEKVVNNQVCSADTGPHDADNVGSKLIKIQSYLCSHGQHTLCGGYGCSCDCHEKNKNGEYPLSFIESLEKSAHDWEQANFKKINSLNLVKAVFDLKPLFPDISADEIAGGLRHLSGILVNHSTNSEKFEDSHLKLKFLKNIPTFVDGDGKTVKAHRAGEVGLIHKVNAEALLKRKAAELVPSDLPGNFVEEVS